MYQNSMSTYFGLTEYSIYSTSGPRYILFGDMDTCGKGPTKACGATLPTADKAMLASLTVGPWSSSEVSPDIFRI